MDKINPKTISEKIGNFDSPIVMLIVSRNTEKLNNAKQYILDQTEADIGDLLEIAPDLEGKKEVIGIKQARSLIHWISLTSQKKHKVVLIHKSNQMTDQAANALLKTLEEPPRYAIIVLFSPHSEILPTIKSRSRVIHLEGQGEVIDHSRYIQSFLKSSFSRQSKSIEEIIKQEKNADFLISIESWTRGELLTSQDIKYTTLIEEIFKTRKNLRANANARLALENLVLKFRGVN